MAHISFNSIYNDRLSGAKTLGYEIVGVLGNLSILAYFGTELHTLHPHPFERHLKDISCTVELSIASWPDDVLTVNVPMVV